MSGLRSTSWPQGWARLEAEWVSEGFISGQVAPDGGALHEHSPAEASLLAAALGLRQSLRLIHPDTPPNGCWWYREMLLFENNLANLLNQRVQLVVCGFNGFS